MLQITRKTDYALNLLLTLAKQNLDKPLTLAKIAKLAKLPKSFLAKIAANLVKAQILVAKEGVDGGYVLAKNPAKITLSQVLLALEDQNKNYCSGTCDNFCGCSFCTTRDVAQPLEEEIIKTLSKKTLADFTGKEGLSHEALKGRNEENKF